MKGRKEHVITKVQGDGQPARLVALGVDVLVDGVPTEPGRQLEQFVSCSAQGWARSEKGEYRDWGKQYDSVSAWWDDVVWAAKRPGVTWLVATRAVRMASLLGLWERIDNGQVQWDGAPSPHQTGSRAGRDVRRLHDPSGTDPAARKPVAPNGLSPLPSGVASGRSPAANAALSAAQSVPSCVIDDPPTILRIRLPGLIGRLWLLDSRNWGIESEPSVSSASAEARWLADVMRRMVDALARNGWGGLKATAGSQALATWRRRFLTHSVVAHADHDVLELEQSAYVGGRCECGRLGPVDGPLFWVDRRSAYAHACATISVPVKIERRCDGDLRHLLSSSKAGLSALAEVAIDADEPAYPARTPDGLRYPVGRFSAVLCGRELADALVQGRVRRVGRVVVYRCEPALKAYAQALWRERCAHAKAKDDPLAGWVKKLLVSLPGKLGQRVAEWQPAPEVVPRYPWYAWWGFSLDKELTRLRSLGGSVQRQGRSGWTYDALPAVACWVLSCARVELLRGIRAVGWENCLYWDTDSLLLTQAGWDRLRAAHGLVGDGLGQWRLVREVSRAVLHGVKHYAHDDATTCAGMPKADTGPSRLKDHYWYRQTFGTALGGHHPPEAARTLRKYVRASPYLLGRVGDGGRVYPHVRNDWGS